MGFAIPPPAGGDVNRGYALSVSIGVTCPLFVIVLAVRIAVRKFIVKQLSWDDWTILGAGIAGVIDVAMDCKYLQVGGGRHLYYLGIARAVNAAQWSTLAELPSIWTLTLSKISIALLVLRINNNKRIRTSMCILIGTLAIVNGACFIIIVASCHPLKRLWDPFIEGHCWNREILLVLAWIQGVFSIMTDFACTSLPVIILWNVKISWKQKLAIWTLIGSGLLVTACSIVRMILYARADFHGDVTFNLIPLKVSATLEQNVGIIAACLPALRPLGNVLGRHLSSSYSKIRSLLYRDTHMSSTRVSGNTADSGQSSSEDMGLPLYAYSHDNKPQVIVRG